MDKPSNIHKYPIIELVVKLASRCNLNCSYCYEYNKGDDTGKKLQNLCPMKPLPYLGKELMNI